jgi:hypothetical protein
VTPRGFDLFVQTAQAHGLDIALRPRAAGIPDTRPTLGHPLDPDLAEIYTRADGGRLWQIHIHPSGGDTGIEAMNLSARLIDDEEPRTEKVIELAQFGHQAAYLATVPSLAGTDGRAPVLYLDRNEGFWRALPIASSIDAAFALIARYLERVAREHGSVDAGIESVLFPWDVAELVREDAALRAMIDRGAFDEVIEPSSDVGEWLARVRRS